MLHVRFGKVLLFEHIDICVTGNYCVSLEMTYEKYIPPPSLRPDCRELLSRFYMEEFSDVVLIRHSDEKKHRDIKYSVL